MNNISSKPVPPLDAWAMRLAKGFSSKIWRPLLISAGLVVALLCINYLCSQYAVTRAYVIRSINFGIASVVALALLLLFLTVALLLALVIYDAFQYVAVFLSGHVKKAGSNAAVFLKKVWRSSVLHRIVVWLFIAAVVSGTLGNVILTAWASYRFDARLKASRDVFEAARGCFELRLLGRRPLLYCPKHDGGFTVHRPFSNEVPPQLERAVTVIEDRGWRERMFSSNVFGFLRAFTSLFSNEGVLQGGSSPAEQLAGQMLDLNPRREINIHDQLAVKLDKVLAGVRISDLYESNAVLRMYADRVNLAAIGGYEIKGLRAASLLFYNKEPEELTLAESFDLVALVQGPTRRLPYPRRDEEPAAFRLRRDAQFLRLKKCLEDAVNDGEMTQTEADGVFNRLYTTLRPLSSVRSDLAIPRRGNFIKEMRKRVPDAASRLLIVEAAADPAAQITLEEAVARAREAVEPQLQEWERQALEIDAVVADGNGGFIAEVNQARTKGEGTSIYKALEYAQALELGFLPGIDAEVTPGLSAREAIVNSNNPAAESLASRIGPERYRVWLETFGFSVPRVSIKNALGAGVDGSPADVALAFHMFGYANPGFRVERSGLITSIRDGVTGEVLFERTLVQATRPEVAIAVRSALEDTAARGTARKLRDLARTAPVAAKTGTSGHFKEGRWQGVGGSWIVAIDSQTGVTVVVRMRLRGPFPFRPEGGQSAIIVAREFIAAWRERSSHT